MCLLSVHLVAETCEAGRATPDERRESLLTGLTGHGQHAHNNAIHVVQGRIGEWSGLKKVKRGSINRTNLPNLFKSRITGEDELRTLNIWWMVGFGLNIVRTDSPFSLLLTMNVDWFQPFSHIQQFIHSSV